jgi:polyisoprenoid-binding protein YceI
MFRKNVVSLALIPSLLLFGGQRVLAQANGYRVDSVNSTARLLLASTRKPGTMINAGLARLNGEIHWNAADPNRSEFNFTVYPADTNDPGLGPDGERFGGNAPQTPNYTVISFRSKRAVPMDGGAVRVTGKLTVSRVERAASHDPSEAYSGLTYSPAIVHSASRTVVFRFKPASSAKKGPGVWVASGVAAGEDFPGLLVALSAANWPATVNGEQCVFRPTTGEDFSGSASTGKTVDSLPRTDVQSTMPSTVGEDFAGETCTGTPLPYASNTSAERVLDDVSSTNELVANEVEFQMLLQLESGESVRAGAAGE